MSFNMIVPMLVCQNPQAEIEFCKNSFGASVLSKFEDQGGGFIHATLSIGQAMMMIHDESMSLESRAPHSDGSSSIVIYLYGEAVDLVMEKAVFNGARVVLQAEDKFSGDRVGRIIDPESHVWNIACRIV